MGVWPHPLHLTFDRQRLLTSAMQNRPGLDGSPGPPTSLVDIDREISDDDIEVIAREHLERWEGLPLLTRAEETVIRNSSPSDYFRQKREFLYKWKERHGNKATYRELSNAAAAIGNQALADTVNELGRRALLCDSASNKPCNASLPPVLLRYAKYLENVYANAPLTYADRLSPDMNTPYIKLALVKGIKVTNLEDANEFTRLTLEGNLDLIFQHKEEISMDKVFMFDDDVPLHLVITEGAPGIGKSTFALEICRQWHKMLSLQSFSLVVLLKLRDKEMRSAQSVGDLLPWEDHPTDHGFLVEEVKKRHGKGVLFVFDGFDEFPVNLRASADASLIMKVLHGKVLPCATLLVTSRPSARIHLQPLMQSAGTKLIEVVGFGEQQIQQFAANVFGQEPETLTSFNDFLKANPVIRSMMYNPLNCAIITEVFKETQQSRKSVPNTQTQLYSEMVLWRLSRYLSGVDDPLATALPDKVSDIPKDSSLYQQLVALGKLAFEGKQQNIIIFEKVPEGCNDLGLLVEHQALYRRRKSATYNFFHLTIQEYLSAFYIAQLPANEQKLLFEQCKSMTIEQFKSAEVVWRFVAGLTKMTNIGWDVVYCNKVTLFYCQCVYEAQDVEGIRQFFFANKIKCNLEQGSVANYNAFALGYCISGFSNIWELHVEDLREVDLKMMGSGMKAVQYGGGVIEHFYCFSSPKILNNENPLFHFPYNILHNIKTLFFVTCDINHNGLYNLAECIPHTPSLTRLDIGHNPGGPGGIPRLMHALRGHTSLIMLNLTHMKLYLSDVIAILDLVTSETSCLRTLYFNVSSSIYPLRFGLSLEAFTELQKIVVLTSSLHTLYMFNFPVSAMWTPSNNIVNLNIQFIEPLRRDEPGRAYGIATLCHLIRHNISLDNLVLEGEFYSDEVHSILQVLQTYCSTEVLNMPCLEVNGFNYNIYACVLFPLSKAKVEVTTKTYNERAILKF